MWSMLAQYMFIETPIMRDLLSEGEDVQARQVRGDYAAILQLARQFDRQQSKGENVGDGIPLANPGAQSQFIVVRANIQEQAKEFLDYLNVMLTLRQDGAAHQQGTESKDGQVPDGIRVLTVHASKGLEFPIVYLPGLVQRRFPMSARSSPIPAPVGMFSESEMTHESGEACLFYVGVTRARDQLVLSYSERYGKQKYKPSPYLDALVVGLPAERIAKLRWEGISIHSTGSIKQLISLDGADAIDQVPVSTQPSEGFIEVMKPQRISVAAIETYQMCPRRYAYGSIYGFQREESAYQLFWQALQKSLAMTDGQEGGTRQRWQSQEQAEELYTQHWQALGGQELPFASLYEQHGREIVRSLYATLASEKDVSLELRRGFALEMAGTTIHVEVDRVEKPAQEGQPVRFVRNRVGKSKGKPTAQVRELLYAQAYRQLYPGQSIEVHHHNLSTGEVISIKLTEKREQKLYDELEQAITGMERHEFPPKPDSFVCPTCPFYLICPA
jgi:DNA helicase II / ATP-dependent DNA helicase PcrA